MPDYNETLDVLSKYGTKWRTTPGLDMDAEIEALRAEMQAVWDQSAAPVTVEPVATRRDRHAQPVRPSPPAAMTPLARREARWGYLFISPWLIGFLAFTALPMIATLAFTFTNINLAQEEPLALRRAGELRPAASRISRSGTRSASRFGSRSLAAGRGRPAAPVALLLNSSAPVGHAACSGSCSSCPTSCRSWPASSSGADARRPPAGSTVPRCRSGSRTRRPGWTTRTGSTRRLALIGVWGIGAGMIINLAGLQGHPDGALRRGEDRRRRRVGAAAPRDHPDDVAGHLLHHSSSASSR